MMVESWDADQALVRPETEVGVVTGDAQRPCRFRYGVTAWEATHHEPLDVALSQESPDAVDDDVSDDWYDVDDDDPFPGRLLADARVRDDDYAVAVEDVDGYAVEELAMHVVDG